MKKPRLFATFIALGFMSAAYGGHCKYLATKYATKAFEDLAKHQQGQRIAVVDRYCKPCLDSYVKPIVIEELEYRPYQVKGFAAIAINGEEVDLAYLFLNGKNLGHAYNCKTPIAESLSLNLNSEESNSSNQ